MPLPPVGRVLLALSLLIVATAGRVSSHGEGGTDVLQGTVKVVPDVAGGAGYAEAKFALAQGDRIAFQWNVVESSAVLFNVHGHVGAKVEVFNRTSGAKGGGAITAPAQMQLALMWQTLAPKTVNVSYSVQLNHVPDLYSSAFFAANLAGLLVLFAVVWELSVRGREKLEKGSDGKPAPHSAKEEGGRDARRGRSPPTAGRRGIFSSARNRLLLYSALLILCLTPLFAYLARGAPPAGDSPNENGTFAFVAHEGTANLTVLDPIIVTQVGEVKLPGPAVLLAANSTGRATYAVGPATVGWFLTRVDADTLNVVARTDVAHPPHALAIHPETGDVWVGEDAGSERFASAFPAGGASYPYPYPASEIHFAGAASDVVLVDGRDGLPTSFTVLDRVGSVKLRAGAAGLGPARSSLALDDTALAVATTDPPRLEMRLLSNGSAIWSVPLPSPPGFVDWSARDGSVLVGSATTIFAFSGLDGTLVATIPLRHSADVGVVSESGRTLYVSSREAANLTMVSLDTWKVAASFEAGRPGAGARRLILDSTGTYAIVTAPGSGELLTFHDNPIHHYHSRMRVGASPSAVALVEPP